jgi:hypothetical protein
MIRNPFKREENAFLKLVQSSADRKANAVQRHRYYHDQQADETLRLIAQRFSDPASFRIFTINILRRIVDKSAATYRVAPKRSFAGWSQETGEALYRLINADAVLKRASRLTKLHKTAALRVAWIDGVPVLYLHTPAILDVEASDPERPSRIIVTHTASKPDAVTYSDWTADRFALRDHQGNQVATAANPDGVNPYGVLPFVPLFDALPDSEFFLPGGADLIEAQQAVNVALSNLWRSVELQAHGQAWASGVGAGTRLETGPNRAILLPTEGKFGFAAPNSPIDSILNAIEFVMRQVSATNAVGADIFDLSKSSESASAKAAARIDLKEARTDDIALWRVSESRLFETLKAVVNAHSPGTIPANASMRVDFADQQDELTEAEGLANAMTRQALGISSPVIELMNSNPDGYATREDAYRELLRRRDETQEITLPL